MYSIVSKLMVGILSIAVIGGLVFWLNSHLSSEPIDYDQVNTGIDIYRTNYCGSCHTLTVANTRGIFGPNHDSIVSDANSIIHSATYVGHAETIEAYIYESIVEPAIFYTPGYESSNHHMPAFAHLPDEDLDAMVYMLIHQDAIQESE